MQPYSFLRNPGIVAFVDQVVQHVMATGEKFPMPSPDTVTSRLDVLNHELIDEVRGFVAMTSSPLQMKRQLEQCVGLAYTCDAWTSSASKRGYVDVTGHWIDPDWTLRRACLGVARLQGEDREAGGLAKILSSILDRVCQRKCLT